MMQAQEAASADVLLHVSDPHFGTEIADAVAAVERLAKRLNPSALIVSGDLTQRARSHEFAAACAWMDALGPAHRLPRLVLAGNHDIPLHHLLERLLTPYARYRRHVSEQLEPELRVGGVYALGVNTTRWWRHQYGAISSSQRQHVCERLRAGQQEPPVWRLIVTHHPLLAAHPDDKRDRPWGHRAAMEAWCDAGAEGFLSGHVHRASATPYTSRQGAAAWVVQAGTAVSARVIPHHPPAVAVLRQRRLMAASGSAQPAAHWQRSVERWHYDASRRDFVAEPPQVLSVAAG